MSKSRKVEISNVEISKSRNLECRNLECRNLERWSKRAKYQNVEIYMLEYEKLAVKFSIFSINQVGSTFDLMSILKKSKNRNFEKKLIIFMNSYLYASKIIDCQKPIRCQF